MQEGQFEGRRGEQPSGEGMAGGRGMQTEQLSRAEERPPSVTPEKVSDPVNHFSGFLNPGQYQLWWSGPWDPRYQVEYFVDPVNPGGRIQSSLHSVEMDSNGRLTYWINVKNIADVGTRFQAKYVYHWK